MQIEQVSRRALLAGTGGVALVGLGACAGLTGNGQIVQTGATAISAIATGVEALLPILQSAGVTAANGLANIVAEIKAAAQQVAASPLASGAGSLASTVVNDVGTILAAVGSNVTSLPPIVQTVLQALQVALPIVETAWGIIGPILGIAALRRFAGAAPMTPSQAIGILNGAPALLSRVP